MLCALRTRGNHLTNRGYLINYQNGYMTEMAELRGNGTGVMSVCVYKMQCMISLSRK